MMKDKTEYLRGLADGMGIMEDDSKTAKLFREIIKCLSDMANDIDENTEMIDSINDDINDIFDTMDVYDEILFDEDEDEDDDEDDGRCEGCDCDGDCDDCDCEDDCDTCTCGDCGCDECCGCEDGDPKVICHSCGEEISLDELLVCPKCHKPVFGKDDKIEIDD